MSDPIDPAFTSLGTQRSRGTEAEKGDVEVEEQEVRGEGSEEEKENGRDQSPRKQGLRDSPERKSEKGGA